MSTSSEKYLEAERSLPEDLKPVFKQIVEQYEYLTVIHYGRGYVAYKVMADLVLAGWRDSGSRHPNSRL